MPVPFVDLLAQYRAIQREVDAAIAEVLATSEFVLGPRVEAFERGFAASCGVKHAVGVGSGTAALMLLLQAHGIGADDQCVLPANTFFATAEAVFALGARPVLVDCEEGSGLIDVTAVAAAVTPKTKAILPVHIFGQPADVSPLLALARPRGILVLEDACQAHGARYAGKPVGGLADGAAFSFYPGKNLGAYGDAGAVTTNDEEIAATIRMLRAHGAARRYHHDLIGWNERMDGIQGAVLAVKLPYLDRWNERRGAHARFYRERLSGVGDIRWMEERPDRAPVHHLLVLRTARRDALREHLEVRGIQTGIHYPIPVHLQKAAASLGHREGDFPRTERLAREVLSLPMFAELTEGQIDEVCAAVTEFFS
ncbi:MAG: DegT/DnrJ/EryC1/StrS family aminotransferase [Polyangiaceae bacterium]|nr:DegT/DnrJ/EryC1/StrS family aminotransferase [Polyangiaceae bacterium]